MRKKGRARASAQPVATSAPGHRKAGGSRAVVARERFTYHQREGAAMRPHRRGAYEIRSCHIARTVKVEPPERICLTCGVRIGRLSTIAYALIGGLCASCDTHEAR
jgi:hypothetical protein